MDNIPDNRPLKGMQEDVMSSPAQEICMGGQAGPGKTWVILNTDIEDLLKYPDMRVLILRRESPDLGDLIEKAHQFYTPFGAKFRTRDSYYKKASFEFPNGSKVVLGHCQRESDKLKYSGFEFPRIRFDEVTQFPESVYLFMFSRCRTSNPDIQINIMSSCNPNGIGMLWVKRRFVDRIKPKEIKAFMRIKGVETEVPIGTKGSLTRQWIPGVRADNPHVTDQYEAMLNQLSMKDYKALKLGLWEWTDEPDQLITGEMWDRAIAKVPPPLKDEAMEKWAIGADFAHQGSDKSVMFWGQGNAICGVDSWPQTSTLFMAERIAEKAHELGRENVKIGVDSIGPGAGVGDNLEEIHQMSDILNRCTHKDPKYDLEWHGAMKFDNLRSQMWWKFREDMESGRIDLTWLADPHCTYDELSELQEEVLAHTYSVNTQTGATQILPKALLKKADKLGRSPDRADALVIWNWVRTRHVATRKPNYLQEMNQVDRYMHNYSESLEDHSDEDFEAAMWV